MIRLQNVVWARPIAVGDQPVRVHIGLFPGETGEIAYEIYSESGDAGSEPVVHSQGSAVLSATTKVPDPGSLRPCRSECGQNSLSPASATRPSRRWDRLRPGYQGIEQVYIGPDQVLAKLTLPAICLCHTGPVCPAPQPDGRRPAGIDRA